MESNDWKIEGTDDEETYMTKVNFYDNIDDSMLKFAVIIARHNGKWVFCKHKERNTWEVDILVRQVLPQLSVFILGIIQQL